MKAYLRISNFLICPVVCLLCFCFAADGFGQKALPDVSLQTLAGETVRLADYTGRGNPVLISLWATWCKPCHTELDHLKDYYPGWRDDYDLEILAITIDNPRQLPRVKPMVAAKNWPYTILSDPAARLQSELKFRAIPQLYLIDGEGRIVYQSSGYLPGMEKELERKIKSL